MSLVSEALRKARAESLAGGAHQRGVVFRTTVVLGARGPRIGLGWLLGGAVLAAGAAGGAVAWWLLPGRGAHVPIPAATARLAPHEPAPAPTAAAVNSPVHENPGLGPPATAGPPAGPAAAPQPSSAPVDGTVHATARLAPPQPVGHAAALATAPPQPQAAAPAEARPRLAPETARGGAAAGTAAGGERSFGLDADLGYAKLHLDYIVYRSKAPFAGINGQQVMIGSIIQGFTVEEIGPDNIRLRDAKGPVILRIP